MVVHRWTLLPDQRGALMHRVDPDRDGYVMCGQAVDPRAAVHAHNPGFDPCAQCATLLDEPVHGGPQSQTADPLAGENVRPMPAPLPRTAPQHTPLTTAESLQISEAVASTGWIRLPGRRVHRPDPVIPAQLVCGKARPIGVQVLLRMPADWQPCPSCEAWLGTRVEKALRRGLLDTALQEKIARQAAARRQREAPTVPVSAANLLNAWRSVGWVVLADRKRAHHPHPQQPGQVLCGRRLDPQIPVTRGLPVTPPCPRCVEVLRRRQETLGLRTIVIATPADADRYDRARQRGSSVRPVRGGLPTLGRNR